MKMKMTKKELLTLDVIFELLSNYGNTKFKYTILLNREYLASQVSILKNMEKSIQNRIEPYIQERNILIKELGSKAENGAIFIDAKNSELVAKFEEKEKDISEKYKELLSKYSEEILEFQQLLEESSEEEIEFNKLNIEEFPEKGISYENLEILKKFNILVF